MMMNGSDQVPLQNTVALASEELTGVSHHHGFYYTFVIKFFLRGTNYININPSEPGFDEALRFALMKSGTE